MSAREEVLTPSDILNDAPTIPQRHVTEAESLQMFGVSVGSFCISET